VAFAVQTQAATLNLTSAKRRAEAHAELLAKGAIDAVEEWADAVWLPVCKGEQRPLVNEAVQTHLHHDDETMHVLRWNRIVLYDGLTGQPLVLYDAEGVVPKPPPPDPPRLLASNKSAAQTHTRHVCQFGCSKQVGSPEPTRATPTASFPSWTSTTSRSAAMRAS
jgi:hypothetical protein